NGDKGWVKLNDNLDELDQDALKEEKDLLYVNSLTMIGPLADKELSFAPLGESKVNDKPAVGVKVSSKGHRDVNLYFDKDNGLLVKMEVRVKDMMSGQELAQEVLYSDYKEIEGIKRPMKSTIKRDGKVFVEVTWSDYKILEKLDDKTFEKP